MQPSIVLECWVDAYSGVPNVSRMDASGILLLEMIKLQMQAERETRELEGKWMDHLMPQLVEEKAARQSHEAAEYEEQIRL